MNQLTIQHDSVHEAGQMPGTGKLGEQLVDLGQHGVDPLPPTGVKECRRRIRRGDLISPAGRATQQAADNQETGQGG